jgi:hypothetical protein
MYCECLRPFRGGGSTRTIPKGFVGLDGACIEKMEKLALLQWDGGGEAKEGATDGAEQVEDGRRC